MCSVGRIGLAFLTGVVLASPVSAQQVERGPVSVNATIGPSFGTVGATVSTFGELQLALGDRLTVVGEAGVLPRVPYGEADVIAPAAPFGDPGQLKANAYHWNGNVKVRPFTVGALLPYVTAGAGSFIADTVSPSRQVNGLWIEDRRRVVDFATNLGAGASFPLRPWLGLTADYRTFFVHRDQATPRVNRFTAGLTFSLQ